MDRTDLSIRAQEKCKFFSEVVTNSTFICYNKVARKQLVLIVEEIRT